MYLHEPCFEPDELFLSNYHIHTSLSRCAAPEMILPDIIRTAEQAGLKAIAITDHIHPHESNMAVRHINMLKSQLAGIDTGLKVYIGAELSAYGVNKYSLKYSDFRPDYCLYSHNHYHKEFWEQPEVNAPEAFKEHSKAVMKNIIMSGKCDCLAHPFSDKYIIKLLPAPYKGIHGCVTKCWTDNEIGDILSLGKAHSCAWEINTSAILFDPVFYTRYYKLGKEIGVCFNLGTDAHRLSSIDTKQYLGDIKKILLK